MSVSVITDVTSQSVSNSMPRTFTACSDQSPVAIGTARALTDGDNHLGELRKTVQIGQHSENPGWGARDKDVPDETGHDDLLLATPERASVTSFYPLS